MNKARGPGCAFACSTWAIDDNFIYTKYIDEVLACISSSLRVHLRIQSQGMVLSFQLRTSSRYPKKIYSFPDRSAPRIPDMDPCAQLWCIHVSQYRSILFEHAPSDDDVLLRYS